uniref:Uncharacterized protein n=1 Tax=Heterorhabditis bacteriophora TaxID=37862 RepID=A0A1I7W6J9_HETBA
MSIRNMRERSSKELHQPRGCIRRPPQIGEVILVGEPNIKRGREYTTETQTQSELDHTTETNTKPQELENTESAPLPSCNTVQSGEPRNTTRYGLRTNRRLKKFEFFTLLA